MSRTITTSWKLSWGVLLLAGAAASMAEDGSVPRRADGHPDLTGTYDIATLTPLMRQGKFGDRKTMTQEEANAIVAYWQGNLSKDFEPSDPNREAPPVGGVQTIAPEFAGAAGGVGGYNAGFVDIGDSVVKIDGEYRTSIIIDPPNGRMPPMTPAAQEKMRGGAGAFRDGANNTGTAWWIGQEVGPYDDPELRPTGERCLLGFGNTAGPPALPVMYNNLKRIVQTDDTVMILAEMNHDARVVRLNAKHDPPEFKKWLGDSIGWWEGDTLVVETINFRDEAAFRGASADLKVTERFSRLDSSTLLYNFTVEDPATWTEPWTGEYTWPATDEHVYEYACHEGNYALGGILRGARLLEQEAAKSGTSGGR